MLADGPTQNLDPDKGMHHHAESSVPSGVSLGSAETEPKKHLVSLFAWYSWQFEHHADDPAKLHALYLLACDDYEDFRFRADYRTELRKGELLDNDPRDGGAAERAQAERIINWYEGKPALYVAWRESQMGAKVSEAWVRKARLQHDRNPEDGRPRPGAGFLALDEDERRRRVAALKLQGSSKKKAAEALGVDRTTVDRFWPSDELVAA